MKKNQISSSKDVYSAEELPGISIERPSHLKPRTFVAATCALITWSPILFQLSYGDWHASLCC